MDRLNFNHLYYFYVVAIEGSIKGASEKLFVTQPTISDQIKLLEEHFDCRLFDRKNRSLHLTKEGNLAFKQAEKIFEIGNELTMRLRNKIKLPKRSIDIGVTHYMSQYFLYDYLAPLFNQEEVTINIAEDERHLLLAELEEGNLDMVFTDDKNGISSTMSSHRAGINKTFVVAHKSFKKYKKNFPESLNQLPFMNYTKDSFLKFEIELFFSKNSISPRVIGEADDIDLFEVVVRNGKAFAIVPEASKNRLCQDKEVIVLGELDELQTSVWGIIKKDYKGLGYKLLKKELL